MNISEEYLKLLAEKKVKYNMQNINGGFSDGVTINVSKQPGAVGVSVNIYGGGEPRQLRYAVPHKIKTYQDAYVAARRTGDVIGNDLSVELNTYKSNLKKAIGLSMVKLLEKFDIDAKAAIENAISRVNSLYTEESITPADKK